MTLYRITVQRSATVYEDATTEHEAATPEEALRLAREQLTEEGFHWREYHSDTEDSSYDWGVFQAGDWNAPALLTDAGKYNDKYEFGWEEEES